jgi:flagellar export protein FliJ
MSVLRRLVRYHRHRLDEKRRELRILEDRAAAVERAIESLDSNVAAEQVVARRSSEVIGAYGVFARAALDRRAALLGDLSAANSAVEGARDALLAAFAEVKRYEISLKNQENAEKEALDRRQQGEIDESALNLFRRRDLGDPVA